MMKLFSQSREEPSLAFGGQALMEGVMIRSRTHVVMTILTGKLFTGDTSKTKY